METLLKILKSRTVWTIVVIFVINGVQAVHSFIPVTYLPAIDGILSIFAVYFKINPSQQY